MGQAKARGTKDDRVGQAIEKIAEKRLLVPIDHITPRMTKEQRREMLEQYLADKPEELALWRKRVEAAEVIRRYVATGLMPIEMMPIDTAAE